MRRLLAALFSAASAAALAGAEVPPLRVMSYNLRYASDTPPHAWSERRPLVAQVIAAAAPDVIGTQEGVYPQLRDIATDLPDYDWIGLGRDGGSRGEFMAVFYRRTRLEPREFDHFWLSDAPDRIGSATWGNRFPRLVTWVRFRDRLSGTEFDFWNTHFDHESERARQQSAVLLRQRLATLPEDRPVILAGDFNAPAGSGAVYATLAADGFLADTAAVAGLPESDVTGTFNAFGEVPGGGHRIDWILVRGPLTVLDAAILGDRPGGVYPSDHYPVTASIRFGRDLAP